MHSSLEFDQVHPTLQAVMMGYLKWGGTMYKCWLTSCAASTIKRLPVILCWEKELISNTLFMCVCFNWGLVRGTLTFKTWCVSGVNSYGNFNERSKESGCEAQAPIFLTQHTTLPSFPLCLVWRHAVQAVSCLPHSPKGAFKHLTNCGTYATDKCLWLFSTINYGIWFELCIWEENQPLEQKPHRLHWSAVIKLFILACFTSWHWFNPSLLSKAKTIFKLVHGKTNGIWISIFLSHSYYC